MFLLRLFFPFSVYPLDEPYYFTPMNSSMESIWDDFHQELKDFVLRKIGPTMEVDDILQEAFVKVWTNKERVEQANNLRQYVYGIVRNTTIDHLRKKRRWEIEIDPQRVFSEEDECTLNQAIAESCIRPFIQKLPDQYREALMLSELEGLSQKELALRMGISYSGAKSRVQRGRQKLKQMILDCCALGSDSYGNLHWEKECGC